MKKLLIVGLLLSGVSVYAAEGGTPKGLVASKCRACKKYKGPEFGDRGCQCGKPAVQKSPVSASVQVSAALASAATAKPTPPPVAPKPKRPASAKPAPTCSICARCCDDCECSAAASAASAAPVQPSTLRVRTGGKVQGRWQPDAQRTLAEQRIQEAGDRDFAQGLEGVPAMPASSEDMDPATRALIEQMMKEDSGDDDAATQQVIADMLAQDLADQAAKQAGVDEMTARQVAAEQGDQDFIDRQAAVAKDAEFAAKFAQEEQKQQFSDAIKNLKAALSVTDLSPEDRASIQVQIDQLEAQLLSLGLE